MKITVKQIYKSLHPFESEDLNDFVVITGRNGSGKTQLIQLITNKSPSTISFDPPVDRIEVDPMDFKKQSEVNHENWKSKIDKHWNAYAGMNSTRRKILKYSLDNKLDTHKDFLEHFMGSQNHELIEEFAQGLLQQGSGPGMFFPPDYAGKVNMLGGLTFGNNQTDIYFLKKISEHNNKSLEDLEQSDFFKTPLEEWFIDDSDLLKSEIAMVFYNYIKRWDQNGRDFYNKEKYGRTNGSIPEDKFLNLFPKPWETINRILVEHNMDFEFIPLEVDKFDRDVPVRTKIRKISSMQTIAFEDLSSGEKVIMSLITRLFTSEYYGEHLKFPELLVLDEPDATLHPEMSKLLLDVLEKTFVKQFGINVIITTHSPSTVALAPEDCIYQLINGSASSLKQVTKDHALEILTGFLPTLSIGYQNQRQVFVESPTDVAYFQMLHDKLYQEGGQNYRLYFISNAMGKGNSDLVYEITKNMRNAGNKSIFGIVDWDKKNVPEEAVFVHATNVAYSIENILVDPLYLMMLFASTGAGAYDVFSKINKDQTFNQYLLGSESQEELQRIADLIFEEIGEAFKTIRKDEERREVKYYNGITLLYPTWYLDMIGHEIIPKLDKVYSGIARKYPNEGDLQKALVPIIGKSFPFVPLSSIDLLNQIENA